MLGDVVPTPPKECNRSSASRSESSSWRKGETNQPCTLSALNSPDARRIIPASRPARGEPIMTQRLISRVTARALLVCVMLIAGFAAPLRAGPPKDLAKDFDALLQQSDNLVSAGKLQEAIEVERRAVDLAEKTFG